MENFFVPFELPKMIVVDADGIFAGMSRKTFQDTLLIPVHLFARGNHKAMRNEAFHWDLKKYQKISSAETFILHQWFK